MYNNSPLPFFLLLSPPGALHHRLCREGDISGSLRENGETSSLELFHLHESSEIYQPGLHILTCSTNTGELLNYYLSLYVRSRKNLTDLMWTTFSLSLSVLIFLHTNPSSAASTSILLSVVGPAVTAVPGFWPDQWAVFCQLQPMDGEGPCPLPGSPCSR